MSSVSLFVGLDDHDEEVQVCVLNEAGDVVLNRKCENNAAKIHSRRQRARRGAARGRRVVLRRG